MTAAKAVILDWKDVELWVQPLGFNLVARGQADGRQVTTVGAHVEPASTPVAVNRGAEYKMAGVRWYGAGVFHRETVQGADMSATRVTPLVPGALIYNRLFAWKGAFAVVPSGLRDCYVSTEFPQFVTTAGLLASYLHLFFTRDAVMREVERGSTGSAAVSRNRFPERLFVRFELLLPDLAEQARLVGRWAQAREQQRVAEENRKRVSRDALATFFSALGVEPPAPASPARPLVLAWHDVDRWGVDSNAERQAQANLVTGRFERFRLGDLLRVLQYGTSAKAHAAGAGTPVIRMGNIKSGRLDLTDLKFVELGDAELDRLLLADGDVLFNRTNSKDLVGKCAVFHEDEAYVFASYLIRMRFDTTVVDPDYVAYVINSPIGRRQIDALSRQIIGQANINAQELKSLEIPLPSLTEQRRLVAVATSTEVQGLEWAQQAEKALNAENASLETAVLGFS